MTREAKKESPRRVMKERVVLGNHHPSIPIMLGMLTGVQKSSNTDSTGRKETCTDVPLEFSLLTRHT